MESAKATSPSPKVCTGTNRYYPLTDGLGSVMKTTDGTGAVVNTYTYDVYGKTRATTGTQPNEFRFAGEQVDDSTGLQYLRNRYYDMATGTFISRDPLGHAPAWGGNGYGYAAANPVNGRDPSGLATVWSSEHQAWMDDQNGALWINEQWVDPKNGAIWTDGGWVDPNSGMVWVDESQQAAAQCWEICDAAKWVAKDYHWAEGVGIVGLVTVSTMVSVGSMGTLTPVSAVILTAGLDAMGVGVLAVGDAGRDCNRGDGSACVDFSLGVSSIVAGPFLGLIPSPAVLADLGWPGAADAAANGVGIFGEHY